jgi:hypothetical protein
MKTKPYTAKTLSGAQALVRSLMKQRRKDNELIYRLTQELKLLAKLAAKGPAFFNPLEAMAAEQLRDRVLRQFCRLNPDGTPIKESPDAT